MPMPQYNGPTYGYNPYQTYLPQSPWQGPQGPQTAQSPVQQVQLKTPAPVPAYTVPNPNAYYGCQQNCYQSCGC